MEWKCACGVRFTGVDGDVLCNNVVAEMTCSGKWSALVDCRCHTGTMNAQDACATMEEHINKFAKHMVLLKMSLDVCHVIQNAQAVLKACMVEWMSLLPRKAQLKAVWPVSFHGSRFRVRNWTSSRDHWTYWGWTRQQHDWSHSKLTIPNRIDSGDTHSQTAVKTRPPQLATQGGLPVLTHGLSIAMSLVPINVGKGQTENTINWVLGLLSTPCIHSQCERNN